MSPSLAGCRCLRESADAAGTRRTQAADTTAVYEGTRHDIDHTPDHTPAGLAVIENKAGAATVIGVDAVVKSPTDGYTLLVSGASSFTIVPALRVALPFDVARDLLPIALVAYAPLVVVTSLGKPYQRLADVIAQAKAKSPKLTYSTFGPGSQPH